MLNRVVLNVHTTKSGEDSGSEGKHDTSDVILYQRRVQSPLGESGSGGHYWTRNRGLRLGGLGEGYPRWNAVLE